MAIIGDMPKKKPKRKDIDTYLRLADMTATYGGSDMNNPLALITGASKGIGEAVALRLAEDGFDLWLNYRSDHQRAGSIRERVLGMGRDCVPGFARNLWNPELKKFTSVPDRFSTGSNFKHILRNAADMVQQCFVCTGNKHFRQRRQNARRTGRV